MYIFKRQNFDTFFQQTFNKISTLEKMNRNLQKLCNKSFFESDFSFKFENNDFPVFRHKTILNRIYLMLRKIES